ncbi:MAG: 2Fe-2S iron-sulfur cluster-binding protein [Actinomycetia bacterium]|nr:2Fe-2S iron-sulfur cluster-binding protein [Actinomycetes bacterium]
MSGVDLVTVTIDERELRVPKGSGMVEAALAAGIEIPVFCYEPRLGPPVGACRMCLCEVEGIPKPQAACTLTAQDGMVLRTAATSALAKDGQEAVLEFILLNHPLDCPDCDKGGECPLQDLTFRYGPGSTRMHFSKRTFDKPIPISPLIALDRERCILCYRCTRFSEGVSEDGQLVALERGADSFIATFEDEPYRAHFSGNVVELCPVGALTSTAYRFKARPWEIQNVPTVCGQCPVGCNTWISTREGKVVRILSRNHPEVDEGWICDKGRFAYGHLDAEDRISEPLRRIRRHGFEPVTFAEAAQETARALRAAGSSVAVAFSGTETVEEAEAMARIAREALGSDRAILPDDPHPALDAWRAPLSAIRNAEVCLVLGDHPVIERAPAVDLWLRSARRAGAEIITVGPTGSVQTLPGSAPAVAAELASGSVPEELREASRRLRKATRVALVWSEDDPTGGRPIAALASALRLGDGSGVYWIPSTPNGRGVAAAWHAAGAGRETTPPPPEAELGALIVSGDRAAADPVVLALAERADFVLTSAMFMSQVAGWSHILWPGSAYLERAGTTVNLEGRPQRQHPAVGGPEFHELALLAAIGAHLGLAVDAWPSFESSDEHAPLPARGKAVPVPVTPTPMPAGSEEGLALVTYESLFSGLSVERTPTLAFQLTEAEVELARADALAGGISTGDTVVVSSNGSATELRARINQRLKTGVVRIPADHAHGLGQRVEVRKP